MPKLSLQLEKWQRLALERKWNYIDLRLPNPDISNLCREVDQVDTVDDLRSFKTAVQTVLKPNLEPVYDSVIKWASGTEPLAFRHFSRRLIAFQIMSKTLYPTLINQRNHGLCGQNVFIMDLVIRSPQEYAKYVMDLAETGSAHVRSAGDRNPLFKVKLFSRSRTLDRRPNQRHIDEADYIAMASLTEQVSHLQYRYLGAYMPHRGASSPQDMVRWMEKAGYVQVRHYSLVSVNIGAQMTVDTKLREKLYKSGVERNIDTLSQKLTEQHTAFLVVDSRMAEMLLGRDPSRTGGGHWILCTKVQKRAEEGVRMNVTTWGKQVFTDKLDFVDLPESGIVPWTKLSMWYQGFVAGKWVPR